MKKLLIYIFLIGMAAPVFAQQDTTIVYSRSGFDKDPVRSKFKKTVTAKDGSWIVTLTNRKGVLQELITFADEKLEIRKGPYALYENGNLKQEGNYNRGYKVGEWTSYYANKQVQEQSNYVWGKLHGNIKRYWDNGQLKEDVNYGGGKKFGERKMYYKNGKLALKEFYDANKKMAGSYFDQEGKAVEAIKIIQSPSFPGGMSAFYEFLNKEIKYPPNAVKNNIAGTVRLSFIVMKDGRIDDIQVVSSPDEELSREAIRVLRYNMKWTPGVELGEPAEMRYSIPIKFSLNR